MKTTDFLRVNFKLVSTVLSIRHRRPKVNSPKPPHPSHEIKLVVLNTITAEILVMMVHTALEDTRVGGAETHGGGRDVGAPLVLVQFGFVERLSFALVPPILEPNFDLCGCQFEALGHLLPLGC